MTKENIIKVPYYLDVYHDFFLGFTFSPSFMKVLFNRSEKQTNWKYNLLGGIYHFPKEYYNKSGMLDTGLHACMWTDRDTAAMQL